ncbi:hypothetical protein ABZ590_40185, partial [Streptomyces hirsutus]|uniref:hypothetical protein n=1 Tax=Streptomyces hirsutus TaxID=35620 RepID=UPI00340B2086
VPAGPDRRLPDRDRTHDQRPSPDTKPESSVIIDALSDWQESEDGNVYVEIFNASGDSQGTHLI